MSTPAHEEARRRFKRSLRDFIQTVQAQFARVSRAFVKATARTDLSPRQYHRLAKLIHATMLQRGDLPRRLLEPSDRPEGELGRCLLFLAFGISVMREIEAAPGAADDQADEQKMGAAIKAFRESHGLTVAQLAQAWGMPEKDLTDLENGQTPQPVAALLKADEEAAGEGVEAAILGDVDRLRALSESQEGGDVR